MVPRQGDGRVRLPRPAEVDEVVVVVVPTLFDVPLAFAPAILGVLRYAVFAQIEQRIRGWAKRESTPV